MIFCLYLFTVNSLTNPLINKLFVLIDFEKHNIVHHPYNFPHTLNTNSFQVCHLLASISSTFYTQVFRSKVLFSPKCNQRKALSYEKQAHKMLMKLTPGYLKSRLDGAEGVMEVCESNLFIRLPCFKSTLICSQNDFQRKQTIQLESLY
jgi:hypothetical protein